MQLAAAMQLVAWRETRVPAIHHRHVWSTGSALSYVGDFLREKRYPLRTFPPGICPLIPGPRDRDFLLTKEHSSLLLVADLLPGYDFRKGAGIW